MSSTRLVLCFLAPNCNVKGPWDAWEKKVGGAGVDSFTDIVDGLVVVVVVVVGFFSLVVCFLGMRVFRVPE